MVGIRNRVGGGTRAWDGYAALHCTALHCRAARGRRGAWGVCLPTLAPLHRMPSAWTHPRWDEDKDEDESATRRTDETTTNKFNTSQLELNFNSDKTPEGTAGKHCHQIKRVGTITKKKNEQHTNIIVFVSANATNTILILAGDTTGTPKSRDRGHH